MSFTGGADRYEKRVHVKADGATETTYAALYVETEWPSRKRREEWRPVTQQTYSRARQVHPKKCFVVATAAEGVQLKFG